MCKVIWNTWFLAYENNGPVAYICSWILLKRKEVIGQLSLILYIELHYTYRRIFQRLYNESQTSGLVYCVVIIISLLLRFVVAYDVTLLRSGVCERNRIRAC